MQLSAGSPRNLLGVLGGVLVVVLCGLALHARGVDVEGHHETVALLRGLKQIDAESNVDVLRAKAGLPAREDAAANPLALIESLQASLRRKLSDHGWGRDTRHERLLQLLAGHKQVTEQKLALIERFKSHNAMLRNSSSYLPSAAAEVRARLEALAPGTRALVGQAVDEVLTQALTSLHPPLANASIKANESLIRLQRLSVGVPPEVSERIAGFIVHASTVLKQERVGAQLQAELAAVPTASGIDTLLDVEAEAYQAQVASQQISRWLLLAYGLVVLGLLVYVARQWQRHEQGHHKARADLQRANAKLKESQTQLAHAERLSVLGQLVGGLMQELQAPLACVRGSFEALSRQVAPVAELATQAQNLSLLLRDPQRSHDRVEFNREFRSFEAASQAVARYGVPEALTQLLKDGQFGLAQVSETLEGLKEFSAPESAKTSEFSVQDSLERMLVLARGLLKQRIDVRREFNPVPKIPGSPMQLNQVFLSLLAHAVHAIPEGRVERGWITLRTLMEGRDMLRVEVQDNGGGLPADVVPRLFDPTFTARGQGVGMGLAAAFKIVQDHGGTIRVDNEPGVGAVLAVLLPVQTRRHSPTTRSVGALASA